MNDVTIIGGGIVGLATGYSLINKNPNLKLAILEKESVVGKHQTGHNSGVIHSGIYYKPGSLKAINCRYGIELLLQFCEESNIKYDICGKVIVATKQSELETLDLLYKRGQKNGINGLKKLCPEELREYETYATGLSALYCPEAGIVDYSQVCLKLSEKILDKAEILTSTTVTSIDQRKDGIIVVSDNVEIRSKYLINCAGLFSDQIAKLSGMDVDSRIVPFRGEYYMLKDEARHLVKNLIYPVPDPRYPFLGVHFTRTIDGAIEAGPNAVLAWAREGYHKTDFNLKEMWDYLSYKGFWSMAGKYWKTALGEYYRSFFKFAFVNALQKLVPDIKHSDIKSAPSGVRAQALSPNGKLLDDFVISNNDNMTHVINSPSPAATSSLAIGEQITNIYLNNKT